MLPGGCELGPGFSGLDYLGRDVEQAVDGFVQGFGGRTFADAQYVALVGREHDGAYLMGLECVAQGRPGAVHALVQQGLFDGDEQVVGQDGQEDVRVHAAFDLVVDGPQYQRTFHVAKGVFGAGQEHVGAPGVFGGQVVAVAVQQIAAVQLPGLLVFVGIDGIGQLFVLGVVFDAVVAGDAGIALFDAADGFADFD